MEQKEIRNGIYPTMITPYKEGASSKRAGRINCGEVDLDAVRALTRWYIKEGCHGIFAACQSSEIFYLSLEERAALVKAVKEEADKAAMEQTAAPITVVASGHISDDREKQVEELTAIHEAGADAVVLISNRMDIANTTDASWIRDTESLISRLPSDMKLGIYECPTPYKRLLSLDMLRELLAMKRFCFFKDTCCDPLMQIQRLELVKGTNLKLFNANAQTLLHSLKYGGSGYGGVMVNFQPRAYVWLFEHFKQEPQMAESLQAVLSMTAFSEALAYPITAKHYLNRYEGVTMSNFSRSCPAERFGSYDALVMEQMKQINQCLQKLVE